jgi:hypothetical protein
MFLMLTPVSRDYKMFSNPWRKIFMVRAAMMAKKQEPDNAPWLVDNDLATSCLGLNLPYLVEYPHHKFQISAFGCSGCP